jgi:hypothetical protein
VTHEVRELSRAEISIGREIDHIMGCADRDETHVVGLDELVFFSAPGGRAWILDAEDGLAYCVMDDHERRPSPLRGEDEATFAIAWESSFTLEGGCLWTFAEDGARTAHLGVPADEIQRCVRGARARRG